MFLELQHIASKAPSSKSVPSKGQILNLHASSTKIIYTNTVHKFSSSYFANTSIVCDH